MSEIDYFDTAAPMYQSDARYEFGIKWLDYLYNNHMIEKWLYDEAAEVLEEDTDPGLMIVASHAIEQAQKRNIVMPAWITDTYTEAFHADSWLIYDDYLEYMQSQEEAKKALAAA